MPIQRRWPAWRVVAGVFWVLTGVAIAIWSQVPSYVVGWDLQVYGDAVHSVRIGHDPYLDGIARQRAFHAEGPHPPGTVTPFTYVYSPVTLPLVHLAARLPQRLDLAVYWTLYWLAAAAAIWVCARAIEWHERPFLWLFAPIVIFFPCLLENDVLFSGNLAYLVYGCVFTAAWLGWRRGVWWPFYVAVLVASCFKAPLLSLLAIPVFSARRPWLPAGATAVAGVALFALQPLLMPALFRHYLEAVELQFSFNHDFSSSPAGLLADALYDVVPYQVTSGVFYLFYAALFSTLLLMLRRRFLAGRLPLSRFAPVLLLGTILLNPRIMEYDLAPITLALALVLWRFSTRGGQQRLRGSVLALALLGALNAYAPGHWRPAACLLLCGAFFAGCWDLFEDAAEVPSQPETIEVHEPEALLTRG